MTRSVARRRIAIVAAGAATLLAVAPSAGAADGLTIIGGTPLDLVLKAEGDGSAAEATLLVRADGAAHGPLTVRLVSARGAGVTLTGATSGRKIELTTHRSLPIRIHAGEVLRIPLKLAFATPPDKPYGGTLIVSVRGSSARPAAAKVTAAADDASRWANARLQPSGLTLHTSGCWLWHWDCHPPDDERIHVTGLAAGPLIKKGAEIATAVAQAGTGGRATAVLAAADDIDPDATEADLVFASNDIARRGSYEFSLPTDPAADKAPVVTAKLTARDSFVWPLLFVFAGALVAFLAVCWRDRGRRKDVLRGALGDAVKRYRAATERRPADAVCPYDPSTLLPPNGPLLGDIATATSSDALDAVAKRVEDTVAVTDAWLETCAKATTLKKAVDRIRSLVGSGEMVAASEASYKARDAPPADAAAVTALQGDLDKQAEAVKLWEQLDGLFQQAEHLYSTVASRQLEPEERALLEQHRPEALRSSHLEHATTLEDLNGDDGVLVKLREEMRVLAGLELANRPAPRRDERRSVAGAATGDSGAIQASLLGGLLAAAGGRGWRSPDTAERLRAKIVVADTFDFVVSFLIAAFAYLATKYTDDTFGSGWDYVAAFTAGAGAQLVIAWKLLPWYRSYTPSKVVGAGDEG